MIHVMREQHEAPEAVGGGWKLPGGLPAAFIFYFDTGFQVFSDSPRSGAYIDVLARPTGY